MFLFLFLIYLPVFMPQPSESIETGFGFVIFKRTPITGNQTLFLILQPSMLTMRNQWVLFNAMCRKGEAVETTAYRELRKKTGIQKTDIRIMPGFKYILRYTATSRKRGRQCFYELAELINHDQPIILSERVRDFKWVPLEEARATLEHVEQHLLLNKCQEYLEEPNSYSIKPSWMSV